MYKNVLKMNFFLILYTKLNYKGEIMDNKKRITKKILLTVCSMVFCMVLMGVSVYAALSQSATLTNTITVNTSGQVKSIVKVYEQIVSGTSAVTVAPELSDEWGNAVLDKAENVDSATEALTAIEFSQTTGKNVYAYKIEVTNKSDIAVKINVTSSKEMNDEVDLYVGESLDSLEKLADDSAVAFLKESVATDATVTYYVVVCANKALADMAAMSAQEFNLEVVVSA